MDIEKLRKINQLSKELKKHGMAVEDAIEQASESVHEDEIKEFLHKSKEEIQSIKNPSSTEQYIIMLERNNRKIMDEVQKVKEEVAKIMNEFATIKKQLDEQPKFIENQTISDTSQYKKVEKQTQLKSKTKQNQDSANLQTSSKKKTNPRHGDYNPDDVSIEKMFYFGNKK